MSSVVVAEPKTKNPQIAVWPEEHIFCLSRDPEAEQKLNDLLLEHETYTDIIPIERYADVLLHNESAMVRNAYALSTVALSQLCSLLAPGLSQTIFSLSGLRQHSLKSMATSFGAAVGIFNDIAKTRFARLRGNRFVLDRKTNIIQGIIGSRYKFFSNRQLMYRVDDYVKKHNIAPAAFNEASLQGRRILLRYKSLNPCFELPYTRQTNEPFFGGYQFENTEVGDCSIRGATILIRQFCDNKAVAPTLDKNRVSHLRTAKFEKRFDGMLSRLDFKVEESTKFKRQVLTLIQTPLGLGKSPAVHKRNVGRLVDWLSRRGVRKEIGARIVNTAVVCGSYRSQSVTAMGRPILETAALRTCYDLFNAITFEAKRLDVQQRMQLECLGYGLLSGSTSLKDYLNEQQQDGNGHRSPL